MDLAVLRAFVATAELGSFSRAAERLGVGRDVVSKRVRQLEQHLGSRLLSRNTRNVALTAEGSQYLGYAQRACALLDQGEDQLRRQQDEVQGPLRIALPMSFGRLEVVPRLPELLRQHPGLQLQLRMADRMVDYVAEQIDVGLRIGHVSDSPYVGRRLGPVRSQLVAAPSYLQQHPSPEHPNDLGQHTCLGYSLFRGDGWQLSRGDQTLAIRVRPTHHVDNSEALAVLLAEGFGIGELPEFLLGDALRSGALVPVLPDWQLPFLHIWAMFPDRRLLPPRSRAFVDFLVRHFG